MTTCQETIILKHILEEIRRLELENTKIKCRLTALEQDNLEQQLEITNIDRRIQNDFPIPQWEE